MVDAAELDRSLDLFTGVALTTFTAAGRRWRRECFASYPAGVFALSYGAADQTRFTLRLGLEGIGNNVRISGLEGRDLLIQGDAYESLHSDGRTGVSLRGRVRILTDGQITLSSGGAEIRDASSLVLLAALETTMTSPQPDAICLVLLDRAEQAGYERLLAEHCADVRGKMEAVALSLGESGPNLPTDALIAAYAKGEASPDFIALAFQYGRYLMLASSRENSPLPSHMGGIWNDNIYNKQDCTQDMHIDMNLQMQYWPAFPGGLADCFPPMARWLREVVVPAGRETARVAYDAEGWTAHVTSNPWGYTALGWAYNWGSFTLGGAWCATLLWDYFDYTRDEEFLREQAYPVLLDAARFMLDYLFFDEDSGCWMTGPSYSPENHYQVGGERYTLSLSTTCDVLLVREVFSLVLRAARLLGTAEDDTLREIRGRLALLPPYRIGKHGQLQEWFYDFEEPIPNHRHTSHLLGLYPFCQITPETEPALARAARTAIRHRLEGFEATSWGYNMFAGMYARLYDGDAALEMLGENIRRLAVANLTIVMPTDVAMWAGTWELDGNTGLTAAVCEMLAQSRALPDSAGGSHYEVRLLPALPDAWQEGEIRGLRLRGGLGLDIRWRQGRLVQAVLTPCENVRLTLLREGMAEEIDASAGTEIVIGEG